MNDEDLIALTAQALIDGKAVGWHQGRMEFGPRALGARSIMVEPTKKETHDYINKKLDSPCTSESVGRLHIINLGFTEF